MKQQKQHCPEVERLMGGRLPFVTRYGITTVSYTHLTLPTNSRV